MLFLLFPQTLTQGVIHNMNDSSGESLIQIKNLTAAVRLNNGDTLVTVNNASIELKRGISELPRFLSVSSGPKRRNLPTFS